MSSVIGKGRYGREVYPERGGGSGAPTDGMPFVQLGISAPVAYTAGDPLMVIPFDTIVYDGGVAFGAFGPAPGVGDVFRVPFGAYLAVLQFASVEGGVDFGGSLGIVSGSGSDTAGNQGNQSAVSIPLSAIRFATETPLPGGGFPCAVIPGFQPPTVSGTPPEQLAVTFTKLFIWQLAAF